ncbi:hypothetical protein [Janthinobacterium sp. PSPC3-1]|uniref:hypothetical protein n=1 Tax=Janthinobacterium sp. PSPC3-1 TaxID=2804653 RepID=UPI003CE6C4F5
MLFQISKTLFAIILSLAITACSKGLDKPLVTSAGIDAYKVSLAEAAKGMDKSQAEAFDWAVSDLSIDALNSRYPGKTPREIIRGEVQDILGKAPAQIVELEKQASVWNAAAQEIHKVTSEETTFTLAKDFFGLQPRIETTLRNGSKYGYSTLKWRAELYLDGSDKPTAVTEQLDLYKNQGGFSSGETVHRKFSVGFVTGDNNWTTLEIQNAKHRLVTLVVIPEGAQDFGERLIAGASPVPKLEQIKQTLEMAKSLKDL